VDEWSLWPAPGSEDTELARGSPLEASAYRKLYETFDPVRFHC
jgi:hypothetical protein